MRLTRCSTIGVLVTVGLLAGCGGDSEPAGAVIREGVYEYELTQDYLVEHGVPAEQAASESGVHTATLDGGSFTDRWETVKGERGSCSGTYELDGDRVTFRWKSGCFGDWAMSYGVDGDRVTWSNHEALPPYNGEEEQNLTEVFNGVPWTRVGDTETEGS